MCNPLSPAIFIKDLWSCFCLVCWSFKNTPTPSQMSVLSFLIFRSSDSVTSQPTDWGQRLLPHCSLSKAIIQRGKDSPMYAVMDLNRGYVPELSWVMTRCLSIYLFFSFCEKHEGMKQKAPFVPVHERTTMRNEESFTAHTQSNHRYYPDCGKTRVLCAIMSQKSFLNQGQRFLTRSNCVWLSDFTWSRIKLR